MTIILLGEQFDFRMVDVGKMPALLTITGEESGLGQPLSFDSIKHAVDKIISETTVQEREVTFFGPQPDPVESMKELDSGTDCYMKRIREFVNQLGWTGEPLQGPSSTWIDPGAHTEWLGDGAYTDKRYRIVEGNERWNFLLRSAGLWHTPPRLIQRRNSIS
ncbi:unnamed protein product [Fusarium fujikuroi]|uniref:Uncharacterized protein n=1 Tax=Fusarium fujikuroi TaxID=5127 RepID=A0A9Q9R8A2_FUSFU|nr:unnamed protein product [Fusarium fujikuroi]VTT80854.1 unnamed protein product [Fusarium fujikuroi]